ncbi:MAG: hypothetical protein FJ115_17750 [Deltaproteobacteria bacterium]|nr:hypothetical protein [Deltaproteobacteria bacterium]
MRVIEEVMDIKELVKIGTEGFGDMVKAVVDVEKKIMAVGGELHSDEEAVLLSSGSKQENLWGINLYPKKKDEEFIEFDSVINLKPSQGNRSRGIKSPKIQKKIKEIVGKLIKA